MAILYIDCFSGISGDMMLGALIDLGVSIEGILEELGGLKLGGYAIEGPRAMVSGIDGVRCEVHVDGANEALSEGTVVALGQPLTLDLSQPLVAAFGPTPAMVKRPNHEHRPHSEIRKLIQGATLRPRIKHRALAIFQRLAEAEAAVHGSTPDDVAFHEVGSLDAIVDIVGVCAGLEILDVDVISCAPLPIARGWVDCAHGRMPLPAPAVAELIRGVPVVPDSRKGEWVTPTGAAIAVALASHFGELPPMTPTATGYGLGRRDGGTIPNALRLMLGEPAEAQSDDGLIVVETNIDDMSPQLVARTVEALLSAGAVDAWTTPILMKKGRPAVKVSALVQQGFKQAVVDTLLSESTSIGVRMYRVERTCLPRKMETVETDGGPVRVKVSGYDSKWPTVTPEYDDCVAAANAAQRPVRVIHAQAVGAAGHLMGFDLSSDESQRNRDES